MYNIYFSLVVIILALSSYLIFIDRGRTERTIVATFLVISLLVALMVGVTLGGW